MRAILDVRQIRVRAGVGQVPGIRSRPHPGLDRQLAGGADAKSRIVAHIVANLDLAVDAVELKINRAGLRSSARTHTHDKDRGPESRGAHDRSVAAHCVCPPLNLSAVFVRLSCSGTTGTAKALERPLRHDSSQESLRFIEASCPTERSELSEFAKITRTLMPVWDSSGESRSHPLVSAIVVDERETAGPEAHRFDRTEEYVVAANRSYLDDAAIERDHGRGEYGAAGRERQPISAGKSIAACDAGAAREYIGDLRAAVSQRVDAKYAVLHHDRIGLAAAIEAHEQHGRRVRNRTNRGCRRAGLAAGTGRGDDVDGRA